MSVLHLTQSNFDETIQKADSPVLVDFWAPWCGPCRMLAPILEEVASEHDGDVIVAKVNIDEEMDLASRFGVASIPTMVVFKNGQLANRTVGLQPKAKVVELFQ